MPQQECSSSENRRAPSERSWTRIAVHFAPTISAQAATEHDVASCTGFMVRMGRILLAYRNGLGVASSLGIENLAIVPKCGAGLQAWATPASQATDRKMKASSIESSHWSTRSRAASSAQ